MLKKKKKSQPLELENLSGRNSVSMSLLASPLLHEHVTAQWISCPRFLHTQLTAIPINFPNPFPRSNKGNYRAHCGRFPVGGWEWPWVGLEGESCKCTTEKMGMYHTHHKTCCHSQQQKSLGWIFIHTFLIKKERWHKIPRWTHKPQGAERDSLPVGEEKTGEDYETAEGAMSSCFLWEPFPYGMDWVHHIAYSHREFIGYVS